MSLVDSKYSDLHREATERQLTGMLFGMLLDISVDRDISYDKVKLINCNT